MLRLLSARSRFWKSTLSAVAFSIVSACSSPAPALIANYFVRSRHSDAVIAASIKVPARFVLPKPPLFYIKTTYGITSTWKAVSVVRRGDEATIMILPARREATPRLHDIVIIYFYEPSARDPIVFPAEVLPPLPRRQFRFPVPIVHH
jgi:hypothetical protein